MNTIRLETRDLAIGYHSRLLRPALASGLNLQVFGQGPACSGPMDRAKTTLLRTRAGCKSPFRPVL